MSELIQHNNASLTAPAKPKFPRPSRRWKAPSKRDLWIFKKNRNRGKTHQAGRSRRRHPPQSRHPQSSSAFAAIWPRPAGDDPRIENPLARQRLELELEKLRIEFALDAAVSAMKLQQVPLVTKRSGSREKRWQQRPMGRDRHPQPAAQRPGHQRLSPGRQGARQAPTSDASRPTPWISSFQRPGVPSNRRHSLELVLPPADRRRRTHPVVYRHGRGIQRQDPPLHLEPHCWPRARLALALDRPRKTKTTSGTIALTKRTLALTICRLKRTLSCRWTAVLPMK